jgi:acyl-CoA thioesterase I
VPLVAPGNWVVMGSSTASGAGAATLSWADALRNNYAIRGVTEFNIAKGGSTTYAGLPTSSPPVSGRPSPDPSANVDAALAKIPKLVLVAYPSNDTTFGYSVDETVHNLFAIRAAAQAGGAAVIILGTQPLNLPAAQLALLPQIDARVSAGVAPCFVEVREALAAPNGTLAPQYDSGDGVHPNDAGHAVIFNLVKNVIDSGQCVRVQ